MTGAAIPPLALYVHWPFCRAKCPYCDFNSHVAQDIDEARFASAYRREMQHMADRHGRGRNLVSVFFGGGTPSLMSPALVADILETADRLFGFTPTSRSPPKPIRLRPRLPSSRGSGQPE